MKATWTLTALLAVAVAALTLQAQEGPSGQPGTPRTVPATGPNSRAMDSESAADQLIRELLSEPTRMPILPQAPTTAPATEPAGSIAPRDSIQPLAAPGTVLVDRLGRLVKDPKSEWWTFVFESERNVLREPPVRILPNRLLETMEQIAIGGTRAGIRFKVSGELTEYRGSKYLLLRKVLVERDMGAL